MKIEEKISEKRLYSPEEVHTILKKAIEATTIGIFEYVNNEAIVIDSFFKSEIPNAILQINSTKKVSEYINHELKKNGINYTPIK